MNQPEAIQENITDATGQRETETLREKRHKFSKSTTNRDNTRETAHRTHDNGQISTRPESTTR